MTKPTAAIRIACAVFLAVCLLLSLKSVFGLLSVDEDSAHSLILWYGTQAWGLHSIRQYEFTPDNWLLSVVPWNFLSFFLFGPKPALILLAGWLFYAASALLSAWIAWELRARRAAIAIAAALSCLGIYALTSGYAADAASHDVTNTYGLLVLLLILKWFKQPKFRYLPAITGLLAIAAISDPWLVIAYALPLFGLTLLGAIRPIFGPHRAAMGQLAAAIFAAIVLSETKCFGLFNFIPGELAEPASLAVIAHNAIFFVRDLGGMLNLLPTQNTNALLPAAISLGLIALAFAAALPHSLQPIWQDPQRRFFAAFAITSTGLMAVFFVVLNVIAATDSARFLLNILYLAVICVAITADLGWRTTRPGIRIFLGVLGAAFLTASLTSTWPFWASPKFHSPASANLDSTISFLQSNNLTYGFGPYHGSHSNAVTAVSGNAIKLRPVMFDPQTGMILNAPRFEVYDQWMTPADFPAQSPNFFVFLNADGEECANLQRCETGLIRQFGKPQLILQFSSTSWIYVWPRAAITGLYAAPPAYTNTDPARGRYWNGAAVPKRHTLKWFTQKLLAYFS